MNKDELIKVLTEIEGNPEVWLDGDAGFDQLGTVEMERISGDNESIALRYLVKPDKGNKYVGQA